MLYCSVVFCIVVWCIVLCCIVLYCSVLCCIVVLVSRGPNAAGPPAERSVEDCSLECMDNVFQGSGVARRVGTTFFRDLVFPGV